MFMSVAALTSVRAVSTTNCWTTNKCLNVMAKIMVELHSMRRSLVTTKMTFGDKSYSYEKKDENASSNDSKYFLYDKNGI